MNTLKILWWLDSILRPKSKYGVARRLKNCNGTLLDVGCGNSSIEYIKYFSPNIQYIGIDVTNESNGGNVDAGLDKNIVLLTTPTSFSDLISEQIQVTHVISNHNLEHCDDEESVIDAILSLPKVEYICFAFPSPYSLISPNSKYGTLNFFDDPTHHRLPDVGHLIQCATSKGFKTLNLKIGYAPIIPYLIGKIWEPVRLITGRSAPLYGSWCLYRFETIVEFVRHE